MPLNQPVICPVLIGRESFTQALAGLRAAAAAGTGRVVLISGEAGIGKSRLLSEMRAECLRDGWQVLEGNCFEQDQALPYSAWSDMLRQILAGPSRDAALRLLARSGRELVQLLPELAGMAGIPPPQPGEDPLQQKQRLVQEVSRLLTSLAAQRPLAVLIEDVHWADEATLDLLLHVAHAVPSARMLLVATFRSDEVGDNLGATLAELDRRRVAAELQLDRLDADEVRQMLAAILGPTSGSQGSFADTVFALTEGNPFFIEEVLRSVQPDAGGDGSPLVIPRSVREAVRRRFNRLSEPARRVAEYAAVAGRRFDFAVLGRVCSVDEAHLLDIVKELIGAQLIVEASPDVFAFRHALTREAVYTALLRRERKQLHGQIAATIEELNQDHPEQVAADLGYHFFEAEEWAKALYYASLAASEADRAYAPRSAIEHYSRAIKASEYLGKAAPSLLFSGRGLAFEAVGSFEKARADHEQALLLARTAGDRRAEWKALLDLGMLWAGRDYSRTGEYFSAAFELSQAIGDDALRGHSMNRLGNWHLNVEQPLEALHYHQQALELFQALGDRRGIASTLDLLGMSNLIGGDLIASLSYYQRAIALLRELNDKVSLTSALSTIVLCGHTVYFIQTMAPAPFTFEEAMEASRQAGAIADEIELRPAQSYVFWNRGMLLGPQGRYSEAIANAGQGLKIAEDIGHTQWMAGALHALGSIYLEMFDFDAAVSHLTRSRDLARSAGTRYWEKNSTGVLASALVAGGDVAGAREVLSSVLSPDLPARTIGERLLWSAAVEVALAEGEAAQAWSAIERLDQFAANLDVAPRGVRYCLLRGRTLLALGGLQEAEAALREGIRNAAEQGLRPQRWRLLVQLSDCLVQQGREQEALEACREAVAIVHDLAGAVPPSWQAEFLNRAGQQFPAVRRPLLRPRPAASPAAGEASALTPRERAVAVMVARGMSNRAIADELVLSERTVETHVSNILSKLGFSSRAQIAAWAVDNRLQ
jgi:tetratricopeptide (TPR) repeat protein